VRVRFLQPHDVVLSRRKNGTPRAMQFYPAEAEVTLTHTQAQEAIDLGKAIEVKVPAKAKPAAPDVE